MLLANLLVKPFWILGIEFSVQNSVGTTMYGLYFEVFSLSYIFNILLDLGVTNFNTRNIAQYPKLVTKHLSGILSIKLMLLVLYLVVTFSVGALLGYSSRQFHLLAWLSLNQFLNSLIIYFRSNFEGLLLFKWDSLLSVMDRLLMIMICGFLLWGPVDTGEFRIEWFVYAQTAAYIITSATALTVLVRRTGMRRLHFNRPFTVAILKKSFPFALLVLLMASYNRMDPVMLKLLSPEGMGDYNAGIYAGAFRLLDALTMIVYLVSVPLLPVFARMTKDRDRRSGLEDTVRMMTGLVVVFSLTTSVVLWSMNQELMSLYNGNAEDYAKVFRVLIFCIIPISMTYVFGTLLTAGGQLKVLNIFASLSLAVNLIVNIVCIPRWGVVGSAWAALIAQSLMAAAQIVAAIVIYKLHFSMNYILKLILFALLIIGCTLCAATLDWWWMLLVTGGVAMMTSILLKLIDVKEIRKILIKKNDK